MDGLNDMGYLASWIDETLWAANLCRQGFCQSKWQNTFKKETPSDNCLKSCEVNSL